MLIISRKPSEEIVLPEQNIVIKLLRIRGNRIVLGIAAPRGADIVRAGRRVDEAPSQPLQRGS